MLKLAHFEITAADVDGVAAFYAKLTGWHAEPAGFIPDYTMLSEGGADGMTGAVMSANYQKQPAILWFATDDIDASIRDVVAGGGKQVHDIQPLPDGRKTVYVTDPAGNLFGLTQNP
jgi:hypothetical protein